MKKVVSVGGFKVGDSVSFKMEGEEMEGVITSITSKHILIKPLLKNSRFYDGYRITLPRSELTMEDYGMKPLIRPQKRDGGSVSI